MRGDENKLHCTTTAKIEMQFFPQNIQENVASEFD